MLTSENKTKINRKNTIYKFASFFADVRMTSHLIRGTIRVF